jgi:hypothetical protein
MVETLTLIFLTVITGLIWVLVTRQRTVEDRLARLDRLDGIRTQVTRIAESGGNLDLRRLEHVLIDIRDGQKRLEQRLLQLAESATTSPEETTLSSHEPERRPLASLSERITNRLLALGYERIQILSSTEEISELLEQGGEGDLLVQARRAGATCKGRVAVRGGTIAGVEMKSAHAMFP